MLAKNISGILTEYLRERGSERIYHPDWVEYTSQDGVRHIPIRGRFWDELQIKPRGAGDYARHVILNAYQYQKDFANIEAVNAVGTKINIRQYPTTNLLEAKDAEMLNEFVYLAENFACYRDSFYPEIILMNFYGLQNWTNAHVHLYAGARQSQFWTVLDDLDEKRFGKGMALPFVQISGTRNKGDIEKDVLALNLTNSALIDDIWNYSRLRRKIELLTLSHQPGLTTAQRCLPAAAGFDGYGSLVFFPDGTRVLGQAYYVLKDIPWP
ncbi:hypothetical protein NO2_1137 [Candidatus Termititenax persephonae]|uniref:Uncharacterized protein n=1 Tax=Candidatus Termititenax persephonae TaxID=2218525 RepID=A0A388TI36_9BACT|nr:hypothetical protein NO2_1137 [Candidatus Termititenax persephonae]